MVPNLRAVLIASLLALAPATAFAQPSSRTNDGLPVPARTATEEAPAKAVRELLARKPELAFKIDWLHWITPDVVLGARMDAVGYETMPAHGIGSVLSLQAEAEDDKRWFEERGIHYRRVPVEDFTAPSADQLRESVEWMRAEIKAGRRVYVHCKGGRGRSATVVAAFLASEYGWSAERAWSFVEKQRPYVKSTPEQKAALERWTALERARRLARERTTVRDVRDGKVERTRGLADLLERRVEESRDKTKGRDRVR